MFNIKRQGVVKPPDSASSNEDLSIIFKIYLKTLVDWAICKSRNGVAGNGMRGIMGTRGIRVGMRKIRVGMRGIRLGMQGIVVGSGKSEWECGVQGGNAGIQAGNVGNQGNSL